MEALLLLAHIPACSYSRLLIFLLAHIPTCSNSRLLVFPLAHIPACSYSCLLIFLLAHIPASPHFIWVPVPIHPVELFFLSSNFAAPHLIGVLITACDTINSVSSARQRVSLPTQIFLPKDYILEE
jgi:hypothetical protein